MVRILLYAKDVSCFNGPVDNPWLDVEAICVSKSNKVTAILGLTGSLTKTVTSYIFRTRTLPEAEALAYLITGRPLNQVSSRKAVCLPVQRFLTVGGQVAWITDKPGIDKFEVQERENCWIYWFLWANTLTPDFYVGAKVGLFNKPKNRS